LIDEDVCTNQLEKKFGSETKIISHLVWSYF
jgi:hypothetical protein